MKEKRLFLLKPSKRPALITLDNTIPELMSYMAPYYEEAHTRTAVGAAMRLVSKCRDAKN